MNGGLEKRDTYIDALKGIAICGVIMVHSSNGNEQLPLLLQGVAVIGKFGTQLFLLILALLSFKSYEHYFVNKNNSVENNVRWLIKKFIKLIPLYYVSLAIGMLQGGASYWLGNEGHITVWNIFAHLFFLHGLFPHYANSIIGIEWYLGVLGIFYIATPFLFRKINSLEKSIMWFVIAVIICYIFNNLCLDKVPIVDSYIYTSYISTFCFSAQFPVMLLGVVLYFILKSLNNIKKRKMLSYVLLLLSVGLTGGIALVYRNIFGMGDLYNKIYWLTSSTLFGMCFFVLVFSQSLNSCFIIDNIVFRFLGQYSYPVYLFHCYLIGIYRQYILFDLVDNSVLCWVIEYIIIIIISLIVAILITKILKVFQKWVKKRKIF